MLRNNSKQMKAQSTKFNVFSSHKPKRNKNRQKLQNSPLRSSSQDYHTSLSNNVFCKNYILIRDNLSSEKKMRNKRQTVKIKSNDFLLDKLKNPVIQQFSSKQRNKPYASKSGKNFNIRQQNQLSFDLKESKDTQHMKISNKQKQKQKHQNQIKQPKTKVNSLKGYIGSKLRKNLQNYLLFINLINYSIRIKYRTPQIRKYTVYIGKGNNSRLVKKIFQNRFWWNVVTKDSTNKSVNLVWSQWSKPRIFKAIPKIMKNSHNQQEGNMQLPVIQQVKQANMKSKSIKNKQNVFKKTTNQNQNDFEHIYDLFQQNDRKQLLKKFYKKDIKYEDLRQLTSKQNRSSYRKSKVLLTHNHIQNHQQLTNKKNLFCNLKDHYKNNVFELVPLTFHVSSIVTSQFSQIQHNQNSLDNVLLLIQDYVNKKQQKKEKSLWIVKPGQNSNRGCGIQVFKKIQHIKTHIQKQKQKHPDRTFIIQKYLNPFLYHRRKFDIRCYMLVTATPEIRAYYYPVGYIRTSSYEYTTKNCSNKFIHLTNDAVQKKQQEYGKYEKGNKVTYEQFQDYLDAFEGKRQLNFFKQIIPKIQQAMLKTIKMMTSKRNHSSIPLQKTLNPQNRLHSFELYGFDFMIDEDFKPWLIQVNTNPCIECGCEILEDIIPGLLQNVIKICVDTVFSPPKLQDWPLNQLLTCSQTLFQPNLFQLIFSENHQQ